MAYKKKQDETTFFKQLTKKKIIKIQPKYNFYVSLTKLINKGGAVSAHGCSTAIFGLYTDATKRIMGKPDLINIHELITIAILTSKHGISRYM